jgi:hypothetical protein
MLCDVLGDTEGDDRLGIGSAGCVDTEGGQRLGRVGEVVGGVDTEGGGRLGRVEDAVEGVDRSGRLGSVGKVAGLSKIKPEKDGRHNSTASPRAGHRLGLERKFC